MIEASTNIQSRVADLVREYVGFLESTLASGPGDLPWKINSVPVPGVLEWNNRENIDSGASGIILFLLEQCRQTGEEKILSTVDKSINNLLIYCQNNPTQNYSLYTGRAGVVYALIQRYLLKKDAKLIEKCLELIKPANQDFLYSTYTSDYLYDGRAGTLLVILHLYLISKEQFLLGYIDEFTRVIVSNARWSREGACWQSAEEVNLRAAPGFAHGAAGIQYVLQQLNQYCPNDALRFVLGETDRYIESCWVENLGNWGDFRINCSDQATLHAYRELYLREGLRGFGPKDDCCWANGTAGVLFSYLPTGYPRNFGTAIHTLTQKITGGNTEHKGLYRGVAGVGLYFLSQWEREEEYAPRGLALQLAGRLLPRLTKVNTDGGLLQGELGDVYFLLKAVHPHKRTENILIPFLDGAADGAAPGIRLSINLIELEKELLSQRLPGTVHLLHAISPGLLEGYFKKSAAEKPAWGIERFARFVEQIIEAKALPAVHAQLADLYHFEHEKLAFYEMTTKSSWQMYLDKRLRHDKNVRDLNEPDEWLARQVVAIGATTKIISTKWDWSASNEGSITDHDQTRQKYITNMTSPPGQFECILSVSEEFDEMGISIPLSFRLILHQFDEPTPVAQATKNIGRYIQALPKAALKGLLVELESLDATNFEDFMAFADTMAIRIIKMWLLRGVLVIKT